MMGKRFAHLVALALALSSATSCEPGDRYALTAQESAAGGDPDVINRRILDLSEIPGARLFVGSPDGSALVYTQDGGGPTREALFVRDLRDGQTRMLLGDTTLARAIWATRVSRDGRRIAFTKYMDEPDFEYRLGVIDADGSNERYLVSFSTAELPIDWAEVYDWSPDGRDLLVTLWMADGTTQLTIVSTEDGSRRILRAFDWRAPESAMFSADGRFVGYDFATDENNRARDLFLLSVDGTREVRLAGGPEVKKVIGWSNDGGALYYEVVASETGQPHSSVWRLDLREGRPVGEPSLVRDNLVNATFLPGQDRLLYKVESNGNAIWSVGIDLDAGRVVAPPALVVNSPVDFRPAGNMGWMPDGRSFVYIRPSRGQRPGVDLVVHSVSSNEETVVPLGLATVEGVLPIDDASLYVRGQQRARRTLLQVNVASGQVRAVEDPNLLERLMDGNLRFRSVSDPTRIQYEFQNGRIVERDLVAGTERLIHLVGRDGGTVIPSPDGLYVVFLEESDDGGSVSLKVISTAGGQPRTLHTIDVDAGFIGASSFNWSGDSQTILFNERLGDTFRMWKVRRDGTAKSVLLTQNAGLTGLAQPRLSPDNRRLIFLAPEENPISELWVLENLPETRGTSRPSGPR